jgi:hypothetical protein
MKIRSSRSTPSEPPFDEDHITGRKLTLRGIVATLLSLSSIIVVVGTHGCAGRGGNETEDSECTNGGLLFAQVRIMGFSDDALPTLISACRALRYCAMQC